MNAENIKNLGLLGVSGGFLLLAISAYGAYIFPNSAASPSPDLPTMLTLLSQGWQRLVITVSMTIFGILAALAGTTLYGVGRLIEEVTYLRPIEESPKR